MSIYWDRLKARHVTTGEIKRIGTFEPIDTSKQSNARVAAARMAREFSAWPGFNWEVVKNVPVKAPPIIADEE